MSEDNRIKRYRMLAYGLSIAVWFLTFAGDLVWGIEQKALRFAIAVGLQTCALVHARLVQYHWSHRVIMLASAAVVLEYLAVALWRQ